MTTITSIAGGGHNQHRRNFDHEHMKGFSVSIYSSFDDDYCNKIGCEVWKVIQVASRDPITGQLRVGGWEAYAALLNVMAMILAQPSAPAGAAEETAGRLQEDLIKRLGLARETYREQAASEAPR